MLRRPLLALLLLPGLALAQSAPTPAAPTPSPFDAPQAATPPGPEIGLMATEVAFGALTAAGTTLLPYLLATRTPLMDQMTGGDPTLTNLVVLLAVAGTPLAVAGTELGIANQSRHFVSEGWPAQLAGLGTQAAVVGLFYLMGGFPQRGLAGVGRANGELMLLVGSLGLVPVAEMVALNLTKQPRSAMPFGGSAALSYTPAGGLRLSTPVPQPLFAPAEAGRVAGLMLPLAAGRF